MIGVVELPKKFRYVDDEDEQMVDSLRSDLEERVAINGHTRTSPPTPCCRRKAWTSKTTLAVWSRV